VLSPAEGGPLGTGLRLPWGIPRLRADRQHHALRVH